MKIRPTLVGAACSIAVLSSLACSAHAETLSDALAYAYDTNPGLQAQRASLKALDESYVQARSGYDLNASAQIGEESYNDRRSGQTAYANTLTESLTLTQPLYTGGRVHSRISEAEAQILAGRETLRSATLDLVQRVVTAYSDVLRDEELLQINKDTVAVLEREAADTNARFAAHEVTMTDVSQSKARLAQAEAQLEGAQAALGASRAEYAGVVGEAPGSLAPLPALNGLPRTIDEAFDAAENYSTQILNAKYTEQSSRARIAEAKAASLPTVNAQVGFTRTPYLPYLRDPYDYASTAEVVVTQPLFTGGQNASVVRQTVAENSRDRLSIDDTRQRLIQNIATNWEQLVSVRLQATSLEAEVKADEVAFYGVRQEQKFALRETIEVLNAELELTNAQQSLVRVRASEYVSRVQLLALIGTLTPKMFSASITEYDPTANFKHVKDIGATPLDIPVRVLDKLGAPPIEGPKGAAISDIHLTGSALPSPPTDEPIRSILSTLTQPPPKP